MKTIYLNKKRSGNYTITPYKRDDWEMISEHNNAESLLLALKGLGFSTVILNEYSRSQHKSQACMVTKKQSEKFFKN